jgi:hypothetical protein
LFAYIYYGAKRTFLVLKSTGQYFKNLYLGEEDNKNNKNILPSDVKGYKRTRNGKEHYVTEYTRKNKKKDRRKENQPLGEEYDDVPYYDFNNDDEENDVSVEKERGDDD